VIYKYINKEMKESEKPHIIEGGNHNTEE
jgi:hypothetical protein